MAKKNQQEPLPEMQETGLDTEEALEVIEPGSLDGLFSRSVNATSPVRSVSLRRVLTKPLIAMAHEKQLLWKCLSDVYVMTLPARGRGAEPSDVRVVDGVNVETGDECTLIINEMMSGSFKRGGYRTLERGVDKDENPIFTEIKGESLQGRHFAFKQGVMNEEKGYRYVDCVEVDVAYN